MDELISRLSELRCQYNCFDENERDAYHTLSEAIKALSNVPDTNVGDTISRQAAIDGIESFRPIKPTRGETSMEAVNRSAWDCAINCAESFVRTMPPSAEPERKVGKWLFTDAAPHRVYCSVCYKTFIPNKEWIAWKEDMIPRSYCPNCGAKMEVEHEP